MESEPESLSCNLLNCYGGDKLRAESFHSFQDRDNLFKVATRSSCVHPVDTSAAVNSSPASFTMNISSKGGEIRLDKLTNSKLRPYRNSATQTSPTWLTPRANSQAKLQTSLKHPILQLLLPSISYLVGSQVFNFLHRYIESSCFESVSKSCRFP